MLNKYRQAVISVSPADLFAFGDYYSVTSADPKQPPTGDCIDACVNLDPPIVPTCCCGCTLRYGAKAVGIYSLALSLVLIMLSCLHLVTLYSRSDYDANLTKISVTNGILFSWAQPRKSVLWWTIAGHLIVVTVDILLLIGIQHERRYYLVPWLILQSIISAVSIVLTVLFLIFKGSTMLGFLGFLVLASFLTVQLYFSLVVFSYFQELTILRRDQKRLSRYIAMQLI